MSIVMQNIDDFLTYEIIIYIFCILLQERAVGDDVWHGFFSFIFSGLQKYFCLTGALARSGQ